MPSQISAAADGQNLGEPANKRTRYIIQNCK